MAMRVIGSAECGGYTVATDTEFDSVSLGTGGGIGVTDLHDGFDIYAFLASTSASGGQAYGEID